MPDGIINKSEVVRYLGYGNNLPDKETDTLIDEMISLAQSSISPKGIHGIFQKEGCDGLFEGEDIKAHLQGADRCIIFAGTLGAKAEMQLTLFQKTDMHKAVIFDAVCDAYIEAFCDIYHQKLKEEFTYINTRFSPGYGDYPIEKQKEIVRSLNADKLIGLTVSDSFILIPRKSVTAVTGIFASPPEGRARGCESCNMKDRCKMRGSNKCSM